MGLKAQDFWWYLHAKYPDYIYYYARDRLVGMLNETEDAAASILGSLPLAPEDLFT